MKRAIISGSNGFVGQALATELSKKNIQVTALVRDNNCDLHVLNTLPNVTVVFCGMAEISNLPELLGAVESETMFYHLAWQGTSGSQRNDYVTQLENVRFTAQALKAAEQMGCECFVGAGSLMEYECAAAVYNTAENPGQSNIYSTAKLTSHYMSRILAADMKLRFIWPYITNAYGENELSPRFFNTTVRKLLRDEKMEFSAATQLYDFIHVSDVARAFCLLGDMGRNGATYCVGSGSPRPLKEYIIEIRDLLSPGKEMHFDAKAGISLDAQYFNISALKADTGFEPTISFREGVRLVADAIKNREALI